MGQLKTTPSFLGGICKRSFYMSERARSPGDVRGGLHSLPESGVGCAGDYGGGSVLQKLLPYPTLSQDQYRGVRSSDPFCQLNLLSNRFTFPIKVWYPSPPETLSRRRSISSRTFW